MALVVDRPLIDGHGTSESAWQDWPELHAWPELELDEVVPRDARAVVVAPHPDDEVLACGGLLAMLAARGSSALVVAVTDGDASHPGCDEWPPTRLAQRRHAESLEGLKRLGLAASHYSHARLSVPDGRVTRHRFSVASSLRSLLTADDVVLSPWSGDGHPDHEASAEATAEACLGVGCRHLELPVWMWHWAAPGDARVPWARMVRLALSPVAERRKAHAIQAHRSQLEAQLDGVPPVLPPHVLQRLLRTHEYLMLPA